MKEDKKLQSTIDLLLMASRVQGELNWEKRVEELKRKNQEGSAPRK